MNAEGEVTTIDPGQLRGVQLPKAMRGYSIDAVERLCDLAANALEQLGNERDALRAQLGRSELERKQLADALEQTVSERRALVESFDEASAERERLVGQFEQLTREREELREYTVRVEEELTRHREIEEALVQAVASAERTTRDVRSAAEREAEAVVRDAREEARRLKSEATAERARLLREIEMLVSRLEDARTVLQQRPDTSVHELKTG